MEGPKHLILYASFPYFCYDCVLTNLPLAWYVQCCGWFKSLKICVFDDESGKQVALCLLQCLYEKYS
jgi:hypothetical protein